MEAAFDRICVNDLHVSLHDLSCFLPGDRYLYNFWLDTLGMFCALDLVL